MLDKKIKLKDVIKYIRENNNEEESGYYIEYLLEESYVSKDWYKAILEKVLKYNPKRVVDIGCCLGIFAYLFANEGIEYIGIDENTGYNRFETDKIKFIIDDYYNVREQFKNDIVISCLCVGYLIPIKDVMGKMLIVNSDNGNPIDYKCTTKEIILGGIKW